MRNVAYAEENADHIRLLHEWRNGDETALRELVERLRNLVFSRIKSSLKFGHCADDLMSCAFIGTLKALMRFDETRGCSVASYVAMWIRAELKDYCTNNWSHGTMKQLSYHVRKAKHTAKSAGARTKEEMVACGISERVADSLLARGSFTMEYIEELLADETDEDCEEEPNLFYAFGSDFNGTATPEDLMIEAETRQQISHELRLALRTLPPVQGLVVEHVMEHGLDLVPLAHKRGVSRQTIDWSWRAACRNLEVLLSRSELISAEMKTCQKNPRRQLKDQPTALTV